MLVSDLISGVVAPPSTSLGNERAAVRKAKLIVSATPARDEVPEKLSREPNVLRESFAKRAPL